MRNLLLACLAAPLALGLTFVAEELAFHPTKDATSRKALTIAGEFRVSGVSFTVNGEPMPGEMLEQITSASILVDLAVDVTEVFRQTRDGRPIELLRTYDDLEASLEFGDESQSLEDAGEIEGKAIRFAWDEEEEAYTKSFHETTGEERILVDLIDDMEVRSLLPGKKVAAGDTWEVPAADLEPLFFPGGFLDLSGADQEGPEFDALAEDFARQLEQALKDFKVLCTYKGVREEGGRRVGEVAFRYDGRCELDLDELMAKVQESVGDQEGMPEMDISAGAGLTLTGEGALLWDLEAGMLHAYTMQADVELDVRVDVRGEAEGETFEVALSGELAGELSWEMTRQR